ncbi:transmembrane protein 127, partial [Lingula anatina]
LVCVTVNGFCFWEAQLIKDLQEKTKHHAGSKVEVHFDVSFYLVTAAGAVSVIAVACNLLQRYPPIHDSRRSSDRHRLMEDFDGMEVIPPLGAELIPPVTNVPPPPPYAP